VAGLLLPDSQRFSHCPASPSNRWIAWARATHSSPDSWPACELCGYGRLGDEEPVSSFSNAVARSLPRTTAPSGLATRPQVEVAPPMPRASLPSHVLDGSYPSSASRGATCSRGVTTYYAWGLRALVRETPHLAGAARATSAGMDRISESASASELFRCSTIPRQCGMHVGLP